MVLSQNIEETIDCFQEEMVCAFTLLSTIALNSFAIVPQISGRTLPQGVIFWTQAPRKETLVAFSISVRDVRRSGFAFAK